MIEPITTFAERIKEGMVLRGIRAIRLSEMTGASSASISQYMSGYAVPNNDRIQKIADALNVDKNWLLGYDVTVNGEEKEEPVMILYRQLDEGHKRALLQYARFLLNEESKNETN